MSTTVFGAVRALILGTGHFGTGRVWETDAPRGATFPYATGTDGIATSKALSGDGRTIMVARLLQIDVWERLDVEDPTIVRDVVAALDGVSVALAGLRLIGLRVDDTQRLPEPDTNTAHRALTLSIRHTPSAY